MTAEGSKIELEFVDFQIEDHSTCGYDFVEVLDSDQRQMMKKCGSSKPEKVISSANSLTVRFHSDSSVTMKGFKATWKQVTVSSGGTIKTPNYPAVYPSNQDKTWTLEVEEGKKVMLTFESFDLEPNDSCGYDFVQISQQKYCGSTKPGPISSTTNKMTVTFHSDDSVNHKGFSALWKAVD